MPIVSGSSGQGSSTALISGITNFSPRVNIRAIDNAPGRYPTVSNTGDPDRRGKNYKSFDDTFTINFLTSSSDQADMGLVQFPTRLLSGSQLKKFKSFSSTPNLESDLVATASMLMGISDNLLMHNISLGYHKLNNSTGKFSWSPSNNHFINEEEPKPFADDRIFISSSSFFHTGTEHSYEGLSSRLASKVSFKVDISANEKRVLTKRVKAKLDPVDPDGEFNGQDITGFCYYNFNTKRWDQVGLFDPATGNPTHFDFAAQSLPTALTQAARRAVHSGTNNFPMQFKPSFHSVPDTLDQRRSFGYDGIGTPTVTGFAPFSTKYHATSSQTISMSEYISHPFLLEKISVELPITSQRTIRVQGHDNRNTLDASRDQDDYVFFIYRQANRTHPRHSIDSKHDVSGSERFLVCSGNMTFYNDTICEKGTPQTTREFEPINTPAFKHNYGIAISPSTGTPDTTEKISAFTGSVRLDLVPSFLNKKLHGRSIVPRAIDELPASLPGNINISGVELSHFWPGSSSVLPFMQESGSFAILSKEKDFSPAPSRFTGKVGVSASYKFEGDKNTFDFLSDVVSLAGIDLPIEVFDPRITEGYGGTSSPGTNSEGISGGGKGNNQLGGTTGLANTIGAGMTIESPYLLFPEDKLVFGMDAAIGTAVGASSFGSIGAPLKSGSFLTSLTGSRLTIMEGGASITFYGSLVKEEKGIQNIHSNQQLTSDNVHHAIQQDMTITDQFDIEKKSALTGTYIDLTFESPPGRSVHGLVSRNANIEVQGNTKTVLGRKIIGSVAGGTAGTTGSLLRGVKLSDGKERFWDTVMPSVVQYAFRISEDTAFIPERNTVVVPATATDLTARNTTIMSEVTSSLPFPFQGNPPRRPSDVTTLQIGAGSSGFRIISTETTAKILFSRGWDVNINTIDPQSNTLGQGTFRHHVRGATGPRYGVMNYRPQYSSAVYRRDRFGQFRDLLEQRPFAKFYGEGQKDGTPGPVQVRFVQALTNQQMDPGNVVQKETDSSTANTFGAAVKKATQSRNLSLVASSSIPFADREKDDIVQQGGN